MDESQCERLSRGAWALAVVSAFLFALGGVATWAQELYVWIPQRVASICIVLGLASSLWALIQATRILFSGAALTRRHHWAILWAILLAAIPPLAFIGWVLWMRLSLAEKL